MTSNPKSETPRVEPSSNHSTVTVTPGGPVSGSIRPPGSKSLTNRALICAAVASGTSRLTGALVSEDTEVMIESLRRVGITAELSDAGRTITVHPSTARHLKTTLQDQVELYIANSGTSVRFLTAMLSAIGGNYRLTGLPRMHERPIGDLTQAIAAVVDGSITTESPNQCPPVLIESRGWKEGRLSVAGSVSSQYLSGLMMAAAIEPQGVDPDGGSKGDPSISIEVLGELVSRPYVEMTAQVMRSFGAEVSLIETKTSEMPHSNDGPSLTVQIVPSGYRAFEYAIEPDASAASYFWAAAAITGGTVEVLGLTPDAMQGDVGFCQVLEKMGCQLTVGANSMTISGRAEKGIDVDMNAISDTVQTLAVVAMFAEGPTRIRGVAHNRYKETDRIGDLACELRKLGAEVLEHEDGLTIQANPNVLTGNLLETYNDHRMAMSLSLAGLRIPGVQISNPSCTGKTYPNFFADLERMIGRPHHWTSGEE
jgi:3-phosphoshikimate 1-carboxyvinyltransferase